MLNRERAFWLYTCLNESILPLNFYTNTLYPQAFLDFTKSLVKEGDKKFYEKCGDSINMFCLKSYYSLFTNMNIDPDNILSCQRSEIAYFMLDCLFLLGDPMKSTTLLDNPVLDGHFNVGENIPELERILPKTRKDFPEQKVHIDRTSQLLVSMSIAIAEIVKNDYMRSKRPTEVRNEKDMQAKSDEQLRREEQAKKDAQIKTLSGFEDIVRNTVIDKSALLTNLLNIEIYYFSKRNNESQIKEQTFEHMNQMQSR